MTDNISITRDSEGRNIVVIHDVIFQGKRRYTYMLKGAIAKAKANAVQCIPQLIETAVGKHFRENAGEKHQWNARYGWYRYNAYFALPVFEENGRIARYNIFHTSLLVRHSTDKKLYLYDLIDIKKETSNPLEP